MIHKIVKSSYAWAIVMIFAGFYSWIATGLRPFTFACYASVAIPAIVLVVIFSTSASLSSRQLRANDYYRQRAGDLSIRTILPWVIIFFCGIGLEVVGLVLGGRSVVIPTLSTVIDYLLVDHIGRFVLFIIWLAMGWIPVNKFVNREQKDKPC